MVSTPTVFFCNLRCTSDRRTERRIGQSTSIVAETEQENFNGISPKKQKRKFLTVGW